MAKNEQLDRRKLTALVHYICSECEDPTVLGATKLNKTLWVSDVIAYLKFGHPITGETYVKRQFGPAAKHMLRVLEELEAEGSIVTKTAEHFGYPKQEYISLKEPNISMLKPEEVSIIDSAIQYVCYANTAKSISNKTHDIIWELAEIGEEIPYYAVLAAKVGEFTEDDMEWAKRAVKSLTAA